MLHVVSLVPQQFFRTCMADSSLCQFREGAEGCRIPGGVSGGDSDSIWRTKINRQLAIILECVDRLEYAIGVANIKEQMECKGRDVGEDSKVRAISNNVRVEAVRTAVAASNATGSQQCVSHNNIVDPVDEDTTPRRLGT